MADWKPRDLNWDEYPAGTQARPWHRTDEVWLRVPEGWMAPDGVVYPRPGPSTHVRIPDPLGEPGVDRAYLIKALENNLAAGHTTDGSALFPVKLIRRVLDHLRNH